MSSECGLSSLNPISVALTTRKENMETETVLVDLDGGNGAPIEMLDCAFTATLEEVRKAAEPIFGPFEATPTENNPCKRGVYWDFQEVATGPTHRLFFAYHRSREYYLILKKGA